MTEPHKAGVRQSAASFAKATPSRSTIREVGAPLLHRTDLQCRQVSVERLQRYGQGPVAWRYRQDRHALFLFERGVMDCRGTINGRQVGAPLAGEARLAFVPAGAAVEATFHVPARCSYLVAFFDTPAGIEVDGDIAELGTPAPRIGFAQPRLTQAVSELGHDLLHQDGVSRLLVEAWIIQAWALLHRGHGLLPARERGLRPAMLRAVLDRIRTRLADDLSVAELATLTGLGVRQFCRRFQAATGVTPAHARDAMRLERAAHLLATTRNSVTTIALDCGFSQPQHLATAIKRRYGKTPTELRS